MKVSCRALSGEVASDVRDILLQPFLAAEKDVNEAKPGVAKITSVRAESLLDCWKTCLAGLQN